MAERIAGRIGNRRPSDRPISWRPVCTCQPRRKQCSLEANLQMESQSSSARREPARSEAWLWTGLPFNDAATESRESKMVTSKSFILDVALVYVFRSIDYLKMQFLKIRASRWIFAKWLRRRDCVHSVNFFRTRFGLGIYCDTCIIRNFESKVITRMRSE